MKRWTAWGLLPMVLVALLAGRGSSWGATQARLTPPKAMALDVSVDPRVELMGVIFHLAGNPEYTQGRVPSYERDVDDHFGRFVNHPAVKLAVKLRTTRGVSYDAPMALAVHLKPGYSFELRTSLKPLPRELSNRWRAADVEAFVKAARAFANETRFYAFMQAHRPLYRTATSRLEATLKANAHLEWFRRFFGAAPGSRFHVVVGLLHGGANYGASFRQDGHEEIYSILGVWQVDDQGDPFFPIGVVSTTVHEFGHSYVNPVVDRHLDLFEEAGTRLFADSRAVMKQQAYGEWEIMVQESVLRACGVRYALTYGGEAHAKQAALEEKAQGFPWVGALADTVGEYERDRKRYPKFEDFLPRLAACLESYVQQVDGRAP